MKIDFNTTRRSFQLIAIVCAAWIGTANAQDFPTKPIKIVVGAPPGSTPDQLARIIGKSLYEQWGQSVIVDNKSGGSGLLGTQELMKAAPDGHTVMINVNGIASEVPHVVKMPFDYFKEVRPLVDVGRSSLLLVGSPEVPATDLKGLIAYVKANPGKISFASYGTGTISHTSGLEMNKLMGLDMVHAGYRGAPPALQDVMGGVTPLMFAGVATALPLIKGNKLKVFATSAPRRLSSLPNVPTFAELGYKDLTQSTWQALWVTPAVPAAVQTKIRDTVLKVLQLPSVRAQIAAIGQETGSGATPEELLDALRTASDRHAATLRSVNFQRE